MCLPNKGPFFVPILTVPNCYQCQVGYVLTQAWYAFTLMVNNERSVAQSNNTILSIPIFAMHKVVISKIIKTCCALLYKGMFIPIYVAKEYYIQGFAKASLYNLTLYKCLSHIYWAWQCALNLGFLAAACVLIMYELWSWFVSCYNV